MKLFEKYEGHPDREKIVACEMGWTWLEEALEADERGALPKHEREEIPLLEPNPLTEGVVWVRDKDGHVHHPLTKRAFEGGVAMWHFRDDQGLMEENGDGDLFEMVFQFQTAGAKIAGALDSLGYDEDDSRDGGFVVAALNGRSIICIPVWRRRTRLRRKTCFLPSDWMGFAPNYLRCGRKFSS